MAHPGSLKYTVFGMKTCPHCKAPVPPPYERCRERFETLLTKHYSEPGWGNEHLTAVDAYALQHSDTWPALATFSNQMTLSSKADGTTAAVGTAGYPYGPYLLSIPNNPYTGTKTVTAGAADSSAWYYAEATGVFRANDTAHLSY